MNGTQDDTTEKKGKTSFHSTEEFKYLGTTPTFKTVFKKKLEDDRTGGMPTTVRSRILCLPVCHP